MDNRDRFPIYNATATDLPAGGVCLWGGSFTDRGELVIGFPTAASQRNLVVAAEFAVPAGGVGRGSFDPRCNLRYDPDYGPPDAGDYLGSVPGSFYARKGNRGFVCYGGSNTIGFAACVRADDLAGGPAPPAGCDWFTALDKNTSPLYVEVISAAGACDCPPLPPPPAESYNCVDGYCVDPMDGTGDYPTLAECVAADCLSPPPPPPPSPAVTYNCVDGTCIDPGDETGVYATLAECVAADCTAPAESYNCVSGTCVDPGDGTGTYPTVADCMAEPCGAPVQTWNCATIPGNPCVAVAGSGGTYSTYLECTAACPTRGGSQLACPDSPRIPTGTVRGQMGVNTLSACSGFVSPLGYATTTDLGAAGFTSTYTMFNGYTLTLACDAAGAWLLTMTGGGRTVSADALTVTCTSSGFTFSARFDLSTAAGDACTGSVFPYGLFS